jgi:hypothetical protein
MTDVQYAENYAIIFAKMGEAWEQSERWEERNRSDKLT